jgi:hypothetical protein
MVRGIFLCLLFLGAYSCCLAQALPSDPLSLGIALYGEGKDEPALAELRRAIDLGRGRALAYYYAARIRNRMEQPVTARNNLLAALADSAGFHDAVGLLAWTNLKLGNTTDALIEWRRFTEAVGGLRPDEKVDASSIMLPEEYRERMNRPRPLGAPLSISDSLAAVTAPDTTFAAPGAVGKPDSTDGETTVVLTDLDRRINSQIRRGYYGIGAVAGLLAAGIVFTAWWIRKRRKGPAAPDFLAEVSSMLESREEEADEFSLDDEELAERQQRLRVSEQPEEKEVRSPKSKVQRENTEKTELSRWLEAQNPENLVRNLETEALVPGQKTHQPVDETGRTLPNHTESREVFRRKSAESGAESGRQPITEEVKALVVRLHREGRSTVEIARLSDLTRTEVDLILAVRARDVEEIVETVREEREGEISAIHRAVGELAAEGCGATEIARRLGISTSEVNLALEVMKNWKKGKK